MSSRASAEELPTGTLTFLFTDIEGSTRLLRELGAGYPAVLQKHSTILRDGIVAKGGRVIGTGGDSFFAVFRSAGAAIEAVTGIQKELNAADFGAGVQVRVRMGLHTGEGALGSDGYWGLDVHRAARVGAVAHGGQVVVTAATAALVRDQLPEGVSLLDLGAHRLKDLPEPLHLFQLAIPGLRSEFPALGSIQAHPNNLPAQVTSFIGRQSVIEAVVALLRAARLVTLVGPGGTGKTRLAVEVASTLLPDFPDGVFFVPLAPVTDQALVLPTVAKTLGLQQRGKAEIAETLFDYLADKQLLLVLDNFEQLLGAASAVSRLLHESRHSKVLVTSRALLHLDGENEYPVPPLDLPRPGHLPPLDQLSANEAVRLFVERARSVRPSFSLTAENADAVAAICAHLDGLPLAIELAAARIRILSPEAMLARLGQSLDLLKGGAVDLPARHQTLRNAIAWSYDLLESSEQVMFRSLTVFRGGWSLEAAENVRPGMEGDPVDLIESLVDKSLARSLELPGGEPRFTMLETIREFGWELVSSAGEAEALSARHAAFFAALAERAFKSRELDQVGWLELLDLEHDNIRTALGFLIEASDAPRGLRAVAAIWRFWHFRGYLAEGRRWIEELLALPSPQADAPARAGALYAVAGLTYWQSDFRAANRYYQEALELYRAVNDGRGIAQVLLSLGYLSAATEDLESAFAFLNESRETSRRINDAAGEAWARIGLASVAALVDDLPAAKAHAEAALEFFRPTSDKWATGNALSMMAQVSRDMGDHATARAAGREAVELSVELGDLSGVAGILDDMSVGAARQGQHGKAVTYYAAAASLKGTIGGGAPSAIVRIPDPRPEAAKILSAAALEEAWNRGASMTFEEAAAFALESLQESKSQAASET